MSTLSKDTIHMIQNLLSDLFQKKYPQTNLTNNEIEFIQKHVTEHHIGAKVWKLLYHSFRMDIEEDHKTHLRFQPSGTILEMPSSLGMAMSGIRAFWTMCEGKLYQIETNREMDRCILVVSREEM